MTFSAPKSGKICKNVIEFDKFTLGKTSKKKSKISDIGKKGRVGWDPKTYF